MKSKTHLIHWLIANGWVTPEYEGSFEAYGKKVFAYISIGDLLWDYKTNPLLQLRDALVSDGGFPSCHLDLQVSRDIDQYGNKLDTLSPWRLTVRVSYFKAMGWDE